MNYFNCRKWENEPDSPFECFSLALQELFFEVPRQYKVVIWIHGPRFFFTDNGNISPQRHGAVFVRVSFGCTVDNSVIDPTPLSGYGSTSGPVLLSLKKKLNQSLPLIRLISLPRVFPALTDSDRLDYTQSVVSYWSDSGLPFITPFIPAAGFMGFRTAGFRIRKRVFYDIRMTVLHLTAGTDIRKALRSFRLRMQEKRVKWDRRKLFFPIVWYFSHRMCCPRTHC